ncbi:MAG: symmetrical bis(5'-nucleosyl)-tetraphosphatase [Rhodocyclaceae bacterium]|nr:symmetrical bis(5'-nucleosyl)-tetraphosphatase [Rhodocyclaceae bacterium]
MARYAIGDVQGCYDELLALLDKLKFDPAQDRLWFVGDLVNRGPKSLSTLRFIRNLGEAAVTVLGNHDIYLLRLACEGEGDFIRKRRDTLQVVLDAPDRDGILDWLRSRPLLHVEDDFVLVHAGLLPVWTVPQAAALAHEAHAALAGDEWRAVLAQLWGNQPVNWDDTLTGIDRLRVVVNALTRLRLCNRNGDMEFDTKGPPEAAPDGYMPWFAHPWRASFEYTIVFGHWSALGLRVEPGLIALDTGCVWGEKLTAVRLEDRAVFQVKASRRG